MQLVRIRAYKPNETTPETTITIPLTSLKISTTLLPAKIKEILNEQGIELNELSRLINVECTKCTLIEIENVRQKITISIE